MLMVVLSECSSRSPGSFCVPSAEDGRCRNSVGGSISFSHFKGITLTMLGQRASLAVSPHNRGYQGEFELQTCFVLGFCGSKYFFYRSKTTKHCDCMYEVFIVCQVRTT